MASSMCRAWVSRSIKVFSRGISFSARRHLLSEAYSCQDAWQKRLQSPILSNVSLNEFAVQLRDRFEKQKRASVIDVDILVNKMHEMDVSDADYMEDLLYRFRNSEDAVPVRDSIVHAIVRAYIDLGLTDRLLDMMRNKRDYGIFLDSYATNILMDHFIKGDNYADAAKVSYEMMLQEDFSHPITFRLSLLAALKHLLNSNIPDLALQPTSENPEEEEEWVKVKVIQFPYYDDHFDIKDERFLLGKTLYMLGGSVQNNDLLSTSLKVMGLGLYQKFDKGLRLLEEVANSSRKDAIHEEALMIFDESIKNAETRDPDLEEKDFGLRTIDDEVFKLRLTPDGKEEVTKGFEEIADKLRMNNQTSEDSMLPVVESLAVSELPTYEAADMTAQKEMFERWEKERVDLVEAQMKQYMKQQREEEIKQQLKELQEKEELLRYFELRDQIILAKKRAPEIRPPVVDDDETLREKRIKRRKYRHHI
ncbi:small ribosomal subunit protein mS27-like [Haliotis asinina]|uniref:small ribosomal subunit protein mS27-like n=1 Tax=Haliotis asinina TaxID=109174 RepID=UPI003531A701